MSWSVGSIAGGAVFNAMALFALFFMTSVLGISPGLAGTLLLATKIYDAVTDPVMGSISDRTQHRLGPRRPYVLIGSITMGLSFAAFFNIPQLSGGILIVVTTLALLLYSTCYTIFAVPYLAMPPTVAPDYDARSRLMSFRVAFLIVGVFAGAVGGPKLVELGGGGAPGFALLGVVIGATATLSGLMAFIGTRGVKESVVEVDDHGSIGAGVTAIFTNVVAVFSNAPFRLLTIVKLLQLAVLAVVLACTPYFFSLVLGRSPGDISLYLMTFSIAGLVSLVGWRYVVYKYGKRNIYIFAIALYAAGMASWYLWEPGEAELYFYLRAALTGIVSNGTLLCALALLPDTMEYDKLASGENRSGVMSGVFTTVEKIAGAIGPFIVGLALEFNGLIAGGTPDQQPDSAVFAVKISFSLIPAALCIVAIPVLLRYRLGPSDLTEMRAASQ